MNEKSWYDSVQKSKTNEPLQTENAFLLFYVRQTSDVR